MDGIEDGSRRGWEGSHDVLVAAGNSIIQSWTPRHHLRWKGAHPLIILHRICSDLAFGLWNLISHMYPLSFKLSNYACPLSFRLSNCLSKIGQKTQKKLLLITECQLGFSEKQTAPMHHLEISCISKVLSYYKVTFRHTLKNSLMSLVL